MRGARIGLVDPYPIWRVGVARVFEQTGDLALVAGVGTTAEGEALVAEHQPDLLLIDPTAPGGGARAARRISESGVSTKVAFFTASESRQDLMSAMAAGVNGYILKSVAPQELVRAVGVILAGERYITPNFATRLLATIGESGAARDRDAGREQLTHRENQILVEASKGRTNKEIAQTLKLSEKTIKYYMTNVLQKLQVRNRVEAINVYRERQIGGF